MSFIQPYYGYQQPVYPNYSYNPQQFSFPQVNNQVSSQQVNPQQQVQPRNSTIPCEYVDNLEVVNAKNCDFSGKPMLYMKTDGTAVYRKQLNIETGKSKIYTYELKEDSNKDSNDTGIIGITNVLNSQIESLRQEFAQNIGDLKEMITHISVAEEKSSPSKTTTSTRKVVNKQ